MIDDIEKRKRVRYENHDQKTASVFTSKEGGGYFLNADINASENKQLAHFSENKIMIIITCLTRGNQQRMKHTQKERRSNQPSSVCVNE